MFLAAADADRTLAALDAGALDNSHPFVVDKRSLVKQPTGTLGDLAGATGEQAAPAPSAPQASAPAQDPSSSGSLLDLAGADSSTGGKSTGKSLTDVTKKVTDTVDETVDKTVDGTTSGLADGLSGAVETVLPDPLNPLGQ
jgi:hypothetical protein